jgi:hypothetical protein
MSINLDKVQLIAGIEKPIFKDTRSLYHLEGEWFISIQEFLQATKCQIKMRNRWIPQLEREFNRCIMDVLQAPAIKQGKKIYRCRVCLQATTITDIATTDGNMITEFAWGSDKNPANNQRISKHEWPRQPRPGPRHGQHGKRLCRDTSAKTGNRDTSNNRSDNGP